MPDNVCDDCGLLFDSAHDVQRHVKRGWCPENNEPPFKKQKLEVTNESDSDNNEDIEENKGYQKLWEKAKERGEDKHELIYGQYVSACETETDAKDMTKERMEHYYERSFIQLYEQLLDNYILPLRSSETHRKDIVKLMGNGWKQTVKKVLRKYKHEFQDLFEVESTDEEDGDYSEEEDSGDDSESEYILNTTE